MRRFALIAALFLFSSAFAADRDAVVAWETLAQVTVTRQNDRYVPEFSKELVALDKREVRLKGFMLPLEQGPRAEALPAERTAARIAASAWRRRRPVGRGAWPSKVPVKYVGEPITVSGRFVLVRDDSGGLLYRLTDAVVVRNDFLQPRGATT